MNVLLLIGFYGVCLWIGTLIGCWAAGRWSK